MPDMMYGEYERRRVYANRRVAMAMKKWGNVDPYPSNWEGDQLPCDMLSFAKNGVGLEKLFPGCSAAWDANFVTRTWGFYSLAIVPHHPHTYVDTLKSARGGEALHHAKLWGHHVLRAIKTIDGLVQRDLLPVEGAGFAISDSRDRAAWYVPAEERWTVIQ